MTRYKQTVIFSLLDSPAFGGAEQYMFSQLYSLSKKGYKIILATNNNFVKKEILLRLTTDDTKTFSVINAPYKLDAIGNFRGLVKFFLSLPRATIWCFFTLHRLKSKYGKVLCLWAGFSDRLVFSFIARYFNLSIIWVEIGPLEPTFKRNIGFPRVLYRLSEWIPKHIITISLFTKKSIIENSHFKDSDCTLVYPGTKVFSVSEINKYKSKAYKWILQENLRNKKLIGLVARLAHENEILMVLRAFSLYLQKQSSEDIVLIIAGDGPQRTELEKLSQKLKIANRVRFLGFVSEEQKRVVLAACYFFIFPRAWDLDGFGITTIEAMSLGLPVLTTDFGPQVEIVTNDKEGYRYKPHDSKNLASHIKKMIGLNPEKWRTMSKEAFARARDFSDANSHSAMLSIIRSIS